MMTDAPFIPTSAASASTSTSLTPAAQIMVFGHLAWLGFVWLAASVVYAIVLFAVARWGTVDQSLWPSVAAGWQRYLIFGAGVTVMTTFLRMLVRNGVTRRTVSAAAAIAMGVIAGIVAGWTMAGYAIERAVYDANGWPQTLRSDAVFAWGDLPRVGVDTVLVIAAYYAAGWIVGACFYRWGLVGGLVRLLPALLPAAAMELVVSPDFGGMDIDVMASWRDRPHLLVTIAAGGALLAATVWVAGRLTRETTLH